MQNTLSRYIMLRILMAIVSRVGQGMANSLTFGDYVLRVRDRVLQREAVTLFLTLTVRPHCYVV